MNVELLILDDDFISTFISKKIIGANISPNKYFSIHTFNKSEDAIKFLELQREILFSRTIIILLDINMPGTNGFKFLDICRDKFSDLAIRIYILTSSINIEEKRMALKNPLVKDFFSKPLTSSQVQKICSDFQFGKTNDFI